MDFWEIRKYREKGNSVPMVGSIYEGMGSEIAKKVEQWKYKYRTPYVSLKESQVRCLIEVVEEEFDQDIEYVLPERDGFDLVWVTENLGVVIRVEQEQDGIVGMIMEMVVKDDVAEDEYLQLDRWIRGLDRIGAQLV